ncbi:MAG: efflux RND transporter permease subunit [Lysobacterales bacterium]
MDLATWSIRNPTPSILLFVLATLAGIVGFKQLNIQSFPDLDLPRVNVTLRLPGAAPAQLETEIARPVEDSMATLIGLRHLRTTITDGSVAIFADFELETLLPQALADVKDAIDRIRSDLPADMEEPQINSVKIGGSGALISYAVYSERRDQEALSWFVDNTLAKAVLGVPGVGEFVRLGGVQREVHVIVDPTRLASLNVTATDISRALRTVQAEASGGRGQLGGREQGVRTIATVRTAAELASLPLALGDGRAIRLDQVATVADTHADLSQAALYNGRPAVGFQVLRTKGFDEITVAEKVAAQIDTISKTNPDVQFQLVATTVGATLRDFDGSMHMLYEGAILAVLVIWLFLRDWRATLIGAVALPLSIIPAFAFMSWAGYSLNTITLLALAVVVGILVDDAIVEVENIARHIRQGKPVRKATVDAVKEIALAVVATTATLVVVFLPTAFMGGIPGLVFKQFGWTVVFAVMVSLLVARIITPMMAVWLVRSEADSKPEQDGPLLARYLKLVAWCLHHRKTTMAAGLGFFVLSVALVPLIPTGFIPASDSGTTTVSIETPPGSSLQSTVEIAESARQAIADMPGVASIFTTAGKTGRATAGEVRNATLSVVLTDRSERGSQPDIERELRARLENVPGGRFSVTGGGPGRRLEIILASDDPRALTATAKAIEGELRAVPYLSGVTSTASLERPEIVVRPNAQRAAERGVTTQSIGTTLRVALSGDFDSSLAKLNLDQRQIDIRVIMPKALRTDLNAISSLRVPSRNGLVPLDSVADITVSSGPTQINRYDRQRQVSITADLGGYPLGDALASAKALPSVLTMPRSVTLMESGDAEVQKDLFGGFALAMGTGVLCVYCVLVLLFKDWFQPVTILSAVPLSVGGAMMALLATGGELGLPSLIGLVMLLGIVTKNAILLVDFAIVSMHDEGASRVDALVDACRKRARPILMTTVAMIAGMTPLALNLSGDGSFRQPMAIAVIGGLISSTVLSLLIVPVVFSFVRGLQLRISRLFGKVGLTADPEPTPSAPPDSSRAA